MSQTTIKKGERTSYPEKKLQLYDNLQKLAKSYNVIALSKMTKVRSAQLMSIRKKFRSEIKIITIKNKVVRDPLKKFLAM